MFVAQTKNGYQEAFERSLKRVTDLPYNTPLPAFVKASVLRQDAGKKQHDITTRLQ